MVTAPMLTVGVPVNLPDSNADSLPDDKEPLTLTIKRLSLLQMSAIKELVLRCSCLYSEA